MIALAGSLSFTTTVYLSGKVIDVIGASGLIEFTSSRPLPRSQTFTVRSMPDVARRFESGLKDRAVTPCW